jgi:hypothetical protein
MNKGERPPGEFAEHTDWRSLLEKELQRKEPSLPREELAALIERAMRDNRPPPDAPASAAADAPQEALPERLIAELQAAQERSRSPLPDIEPVETGVEAAPAHLDSGAAVPIRAPFLKELLARSKAAVRKLRRLNIRRRLREWRGRYHLALSLLHRHVFDRRIERLLFIKTAGPYSSMEAGEDGGKAFRYRGPIPAMVFSWALSALPSDLKRYAFADLHAGNGRTLLLACGRNFEHAVGYAFDSEGLAVLEMNLAQYSRSYMICRDAGAVRGDRAGISIPPQPAVLFVPESLGEAQLRAVLSQLPASIRLNPRPIYLIVENSGLECGLDQMLLFRKLPLPLLTRLKLSFFSPSNVAVYKSLNCGEPG